MLIRRSCITKKLYYLTYVKSWKREKLKFYRIKKKFFNYLKLFNFIVFYNKLGLIFYFKKLNNSEFENECEIV